MAGMGKRLRPHTLVTPKPLLQVAGKSIVQRLVEDIVSVSDQKVTEIAYVVGRFGEEAERNLIAVAEALGAKGTIHYQDEPLGTAHAILCAKSALEGPVTVAFADTLFKADFKLDQSKDGVLWVQRIEDPRQFGVVITNEQGVITGFKEKPQEFVSDLAMIGIYYFQKGEVLRDELQYLLDNKIMNGGEYQLPDALRNMMAKGAQFSTGAVEDWMDCGNKDAVVDTNQKVLHYNQDKNWVSKNVVVENSHIIQPCFIADGVVLKNAIVGPYASVSSNTTIEHSVVSNSILGANCKVANAVIKDSLIGSHASISGKAINTSLGDYSTITL
jgi:glucose-1-phosphate thymidylyltransferase